MPPADPIFTERVPAPTVSERLRSLIRRRELRLVALALVVGILAGVGVFAISQGAQALHVLFFRISDDDRLSGASSIPLVLAMSVPPLGGLALGLFNLVALRWWPRRPVDPIEANALHGGRMSLRDSLIVTLQTFLSNGVGASVGLEAAYTQLGSSLASRVGTRFGLRRSDMRLLVGCGSAGAIAAAFGAPLAGAFYGFEIVIASYTPTMMAPILTAAMAGYGLSEILGGRPYVIDAPPAFAANAAGFVTLALLGLCCAGGAILVMQAVTLCERLFRSLPIRAALLPALGGLCIGGLALISPRVLSAGHGALEQSFDFPAWTLATLGGLLVLKVAASAISLGSGFRGGLFFASLFLGSMLGQFFIAVLAAFHIAPGIDAHAAALAGMAGLAAAIVGGPLTMSFLVLEVTGDLRITICVLLTVLVGWITVRETFGYSFATWRFHVRGEAIRSAHDVGWMRQMTAGSLMRRDIPAVSSDMTLANFRRAFPLGSASYVIAVRPGHSAYAGLMPVAEAHQHDRDADAEATPLTAYLVRADDTLLPDMTIKEIALAFEQTDSEALAVIADRRSRRVVGFLTESFALRRYAEELDKARRDLSGEA